MRNVNMKGDGVVYWTPTMVIEEQHEAYNLDDELHTGRMTTKQGVTLIRKINHIAKTRAKRGISETLPNAVKVL